VLTPDQKGAIAESAISHAAIRLGVGVARPFGDERYNQSSGIRWAQDFDFAAKLGRQRGAIAQLGERLHGMQEVAGSSPAGSTSEAALRAASLI
jgi:hypothetical protein